MALSPHPSRAFTLIELLVVIAIIGILSSVVLASLNVARERGRDASIRSTLKNMSAEIELLQESNGGNYNFVNNCHNAGHVLEKFVTALTAQNATVRCYSQMGVSNNARWGASVRSNEVEFRAWSASQNGAARWDSASGTSAPWSTALSACAATGGRMPTIEELKSLRDAFGAVPTGFGTSYQWSQNEIETNANNAWGVLMSDGVVHSGGAKTNSWQVRCIR